MDGIDFLNFAKTLLDTNDEAALRTAVSRSYYAIFHQIKETLVSVGIPVGKSPKEHQRLVKYLRVGGRQAGIENANKYGDLLNGLRVSRNEADYDLHKSRFNQKTCKLHWKLAETIHTVVHNNIDTYKRGFVNYAESINDFKKR